MIVLEAGKSYRLNNGWKLVVVKQTEVDEYYGTIYQIDGDSETFYSSDSYYTRDGKYKVYQSDTSFRLHVSHYWSELGTSGRVDVDGWDTERFRKAVANSGLFNF